MRPFLQKDDQRLPDSYGIKITLVSGKVEDYDIVSHKTYDQERYFEILTKDDLWLMFPIINIIKVEFDKNFSKIVAIKQELRSKENAA